MKSLRPFLWALFSCVMSGCDCGGGARPTLDASVQDADRPGDASLGDADLLRCARDADCVGDTYCDTSTGLCVPYGGSRDRDPMCRRVIAAGTFSPTVQCVFNETPPGDPFPDHLHVLSTPMVVDFGIDRSPSAGSRPSIVAVFDDGGGTAAGDPTGVVRILDGRTCRQQAQLGSLEMASNASPPAIGDLTGDGRPEIVVSKGNGGFVAFTYDAVSRGWRVLWRSRTEDGSAAYEPTDGPWTGPSLYDLDDDGTPEVLHGATVLSATGILLTEAQSFILTAGGGGEHSVVANVDGDPQPELVTGWGSWEWDSTVSAWREEAWSPGYYANGTVALGDFGHYPGSQGWSAETPEVVAVSGGYISVRTLDGQEILPWTAIARESLLGAPATIADFDGDGRREIGVAGDRFYSVIDLDCLPGGGSLGQCASGATNGFLWRKANQDFSSGSTGSSVFDFEGDGRAEVVYADECFVRVYDGRTGDVLFSQAHSSATWFEYPVIADVDGDFNAEIVAGSNYNSDMPEVTTDGIACPTTGPRGVDTLHAGLRCDEDSECVSNRCDQGFCRCTRDADCCVGAGCDRAALICEAPPSGTPGSGNTCRASRPRGTFGIRVYADAADRWVRSRMIWNQHAYFVTNVGDDGTIPRTSAARRNWREPTLNNFRQNVQGESAPGAAPDLTGSAAAAACSDDGTSATLSARVCNRGTEPVGTGLRVDFHEGASPTTRTICQGFSTRALSPGECETVGCTWARPSDGGAIAVIDAESAAGECREDNNTAAIAPFSCVAIR